MPVFNWIRPLISATSGWYVGIFEFIAFLNMCGSVNWPVVTFGVMRSLDMVWCVHMNRTHSCSSQYTLLPQLHSVCCDHQLMVANVTLTFTFALRKSLMVTGRHSAKVTNQSSRFKWRSNKWITQESSVWKPRNVKCQSLYKNYKTNLLMIRKQVNGQSCKYTESRPKPTKCNINFTVKETM